MGKAKNKGFVWGKKEIDILRLLVDIIFIACVVGTIIYVGIRNMTYAGYSELRNHTCVTMNGNWTLTFPSGQCEQVAMPAIVKCNATDKIVLEHQIIEPLTDKDYLSTRIVAQNVTMYVDGAVRGRFINDMEAKPFRNDYVNRNIYIPMYRSDIGKTIRIEATGLLNNKRYFSEIYCGEKVAIIDQYFKNNTFAFIMAVSFFVLGVISVILGLFIKQVTNGMYRYDYIGWAMFILSMWNITQSSFRDMLFANIKGISLVPAFMLMLFPIPVAMYFNSIQKNRYAKWHFGFVLAALIHMLFRAILQFTCISDLYQGLPTIFALIYAYSVVICVTLVMDFKAGYAYNYIRVLYGFIGNMFIGTFQIADFIAHPGDCDATWLCGGFAILCFFCFSQGFADILTTEKERTKATEIALMKSNFLSTMSHEIRTPINAVLGMNEVILRETDDDKIIEYAKQVDKSGNMLLTLVNDILDFSRLESGNMKICENTYDLYELLGSCRNMIKKRADEKGLKINVDIQRGFPTVLRGDDVRIRQIVTNLLTNAVKYTNKGSISIRAFFKNVESDRLSLCIDVKDTGVGIRDEDKAGLFKAFVRADELHNRNIEGTGLGLAITGQLVELMHGTIEVDSTFGEGSLFRVVIPQGIAEINDDEKIKNNQRATDSLTNFTAPEAEILVVDDVKVNIIVFEKLLSDTRIKVDTALSADECVSLSLNKKYDLIFLDHMMPDKDGIEALREIRSNENNVNVNTPAVMLTANVTNDSRDVYSKEGFDDYISKPVNAKTLHNVLYKLLPSDKIVKS
ncbi:MAG: response regulator [Lachnospiraceae bacterium]|nr:response regulator [Candidatus Colinaster equi]